MADEKRQLILDLLARNRTSKDTEQAADSIDKLGKSADEASKKTEKLGKSSKDTGQQTDRLGRSADITRGKVGNLNKEIDNIERELGTLADSFADAGSAAERLDISKAIRRTENDLRRVTKSRNLLENLLPDPEPEARSWGKKLASSLSGVGDSVATLAGGHMGIVLGGAVVAAAAPVLAGGIMAAVTAGLGLGIIGAGALLLKNDKAITGWATRIGQNFKTNLVKQAEGALEPPFLRSLGKIEAFTNRSAGKIGLMFYNLAPSVDHFTDSLVNAGDILVDGLGKSAENAGPAIDGLGDSIVLVTSGISNFIQTLSEGGPEAADNLRLIAGGTADVITQTGTFLGFLNKVSDNPWITGPLLPLLRDHYKDVAEASNTAATATDTLATANSNAQKAALGQRDALAGLANELRAQVDPAFALLNAQDKVRDSQEALSEATKKYGANSEQARSASRQLASAALDLQGAAGGLSSTFTGKLSPSMLATLKSAGLTKSQIAAVSREFARAEAAGDAYAGNYVANIITNHIETFSQEHQRELSRFRAAGGPVTRGVPYIVGENGPELVVPDASGRVLSAAASRGVMTQAGAAGSSAYLNGGQGGGMRGGTLQLEVAGEQRVASFLKYMIRTYNILDA